MAGLEHKYVLQEEGIQLSQLKRREISYPVPDYIMSIHSLNRLSRAKNDQYVQSILRKYMGSPRD